LIVEGLKGADEVFPAGILFQKTPFRPPFSWC